MSPVRTLTLVLALSSGVTLIPGVSVAWAQASGAPWLAIAPVGAVIADGSEVRLQVIAMSASGAPLAGLKLKATADAGRVVSLTEGENGVYWVTFVPSSGASAATVTVRGRTADRANLEASASLALVPPLRTTITAEFDAPTLVLGEAAELGLRIHTGPGLDVEDLSVVASTGSVKDLQKTGEGEFRATYVAPRLNYPHLAMVALSHRAHPDQVYGSAILPLVGKVPFPVKAAAGASVSLRIEGEEFGPVTADERGTARVPILVKPGQQSATRKIQVGSQLQEEVIDLKVPETARMQVFPPAAVAVSGAPVPVMVSVRTPSGEPDSAATLQLSSDQGSFGAVTALGRGLYRALYSPPAVSQRTDIALRAALDGSSIQKSETALSLIPPLAQGVSLTSEPRVLGAATGKIKVFARAVGADGKGMGGRAWNLLAVGGTTPAAPVDLRNGDYRLDVDAAPGTGLAVVAALRAPPTGLPPERVLLVPLKRGLTADGASRMPLAVAVVDAVGVPVPNRTITLSVRGDAAVTAEVETGPGGVGLTLLTAGHAPGLLQLSATAPGVYSDALGIFQGIHKEFSPAGGVPEVEAQRAQLAHTLALIEVSREGAADALAGGLAPSAAVASAAPVVEEPVVAPPPAAPAVREAAPAGTPVATLTVSVRPDSVAPGGSAVVVVTAADAEDHLIPGVSLEFMLSQGKIGRAAEVRPGVYEAELSLPRGATGSVKVTAIANDGELVKFAKVPVAPAPSGAAISLDTAPPPPKAQPSFSKEGPVVWGGLAFGSYRYEQVPLLEDGPLLPSVFTIGGEDGDNAHPVGGALGARAWLLPWLGGEVGLRTAHYSVTAEEFAGAEVSDNLIRVSADLLAKYSYDLGPAAISAAARVGLRADDLIVYKGSVDSGVIDYQALSLWGSTLGFQLGVEAGDLAARADLARGFSAFTQGYATEFGLGLEYSVTPHLLVLARGDGSVRDLAVVGLDSGRDLGTLSDGLSLATLGLGYRR